MAKKVDDDGPQFTAADKAFMRRWKADCEPMRESGSMLDADGPDCPCGASTVMWFESCHTCGAQLCPACSGVYAHNGERYCKDHRWGTSAEERDGAAPSSGGDA